MEIMTILEEIIRSWRKVPKGPVPRLDALKVLVALKVIEREGPIGRYALARKLKLSQGVVRGLIDRLKARGLIEVAKGGCTLTREGEAAIHEYLEAKRVVELEELEASKISKLAPGEFVVGIKVEGGAAKVIDGILQRDEAIKSGASGATTLIVENGEIRFPKTREVVGKIYSKEIEYLKSKFKVEEGDAILLCWAEDEVRAFEGAIGAALTLVRDGK